MSSTLKRMLKDKCPSFILLPALRMRDAIRNWRLVNARTSEVFTDIYRRRGWPAVSVSGKGSDFEQTNAVRGQLPKLLETYHIQSLLDLPCGDFSWMKLVELGTRSYTGGDIVHEIIADNMKQYASVTRQFRVLDLMRDPLPQADAILCRDCLIHLSFRDAKQSLGNIAKSAVPFLLTTTYPLIKRNTDILTGGFRAINLELAPFNFPKPLAVIDEDLFPDLREDPNFIRQLGLWRTKDLPNFHEAVG